MMMVVLQNNRCPAVVLFLLLDDNESIRNNTANPNVAADEVSITKPHWLVLWLPSPLPTDHRFSISVKDAKGGSVTNWTYLYKAENAYKFIYFEVHPNFKTHAPGKWTATGEIKGIGNYKAQYTVLASTPAENAQFQLYEQGAEEALNAVAHYWTAYKGSYFAFLDKDRLIQVRDILPWWRTAELSPADKLNGLTYRGHVSFSFDVYRTYSTTNGWTKWYDIKPKTEGSDNPMAAVFAAAFSQLIPEATQRILNEPEQQVKFRQSLALNYSFEQRDGNWFVQPGRPKTRDDNKTYELRPANKSDDDDSAPDQTKESSVFSPSMVESYWSLVPYARFVNGKQVAGDPTANPRLSPL
jgi:hypothetical protein